MKVINLYENIRKGGKCYVKMKKQWIAIIISFCFIGITFLSFGFIANNVEHECLQEHCSICIHINQVIEHMKLLGGAIAFSFSCLVVRLCYELLKVQVMFHGIGITLVNCKVRMNN